ncbi:MAG: amidohydrolase family protein [Rudaea sp.]
MGAAEAVGSQDEAGTLTVGKRADWVVLSQDIFSIPPREIAQSRVEQTTVGGEIVYGG